jgi:rubrerythrin
MSEDILTRAIHREIQTRDFYREVSDGIKNKQGRRQMSKLSGDEDRHRAILSSRFKALFGRDFVPDPHFPASPGLDSPRNAVYDQAKALEVVSIGITFENDSIDLYAGLIDKVTDPADIKLLKKLVKFEQGHRQKLQDIYERLHTEGNYWMKG